MAWTLAVLLALWVTARWVGFVAGAVRARRFTGSVRKEARRAVVGRAALNVVLSVATLYAFALALDLQPTETFVGFLGAVTIFALVAWATAGFMQPADRTRETLELFGLRPRPPTDDPVRPVGSVLETDGDGYLVNPCAPEQIRPPWDGLVDEARETATTQLGPRLHSLYLRGSVPRGEAIEGLSDLDLVAVVDGGAGETDTTWLEAFEQDALSRHPFCTGIELLVVGRDEVLRDEGRSAIGFVLATGTLCIEGEDLTPSLPRFRPGDPEAAVHALQLGADIERFLEEGPLESPEERRASCAWICKRIVRAGFELVMEAEGTYTRDLWPCYEAFRRHHPEWSGEMRRVLEIAVDPLDAPDEVAELCRGLGAWVAHRGTLRFEPRGG